MANLNNEMKKIVDVISGEKALREKEKALKEAKKIAMEEEKVNRRKSIVSGKVELEKGLVKDPEVIQNIKLFEWKAPDRYEFKYESKSFLILVAVSLFFILLLAILGHYFMMAAVISMLFFVYVAGTTKPIIVEHKITARGIDSIGRLFEWYMLDSFYFTKRGNISFLLVETKLNWPGLLIMIIDEKDRDALFVLLQKKLLYKNIKKQGYFDKMSYGEYIPLEDL